jgi:hypothetical protein
MFAVKVPDQACVFATITLECTLSKINASPGGARSVRNERVQIVHAVHAGCTTIYIGDTVIEQQVHHMPLFSAPPQVQKIKENIDYHENSVTLAVMDSERIVSTTV